jgi:hypothetical protein
MTTTTRDVAKAQREASVAAENATRLQAELDRALAAAEGRRQERLNRWADAVIAGFDADQTAAETALHDARLRFQQVAVHEPAETVPAYLAWALAWGEHRHVYMKLTQALGQLERQTFRGAGMPAIPTRGIPGFGDAVTAAIAAEASRVMEAPQERLNAYLTAIMEDRDDGR